MGVAGVVPNVNHPVCARIRRLRSICSMGAATPPNLGGELGTRKMKARKP